VLRAKTTGEGSFLEVAQSDAAAAMDWYRSETWKAYERPDSEVTGNKATTTSGGSRARPGWWRACATRSNQAKDGRFVLFMASEQAFWKNFCAAVDRIDMFERWPGSKYADHARNNLEMRRELRDIFRTRTAEEWIDFGVTANVPISPVKLPEDHRRGTRSFNGPVPLVLPRAAGAEQLPTPLKFGRRGAAHPGACANRRPAHRRGAP